MKRERERREKWAVQGGKQQKQNNVSSEGEQMVRGNGPRSGAGQHRGEATRSMLYLYGRDWCCKGPNLYYNKGETDKRKMREKWSYSV